MAIGTGLALCSRLLGSTPITNLFTNFGAGLVSVFTDTEYEYRPDLSTNKARFQE